jgi:hypothetical protein
MWYVEGIGLIKTPRGITKNNVQHPRNIFKLWSKEELAAIGIKPARFESVDYRYVNTGELNWDLSSEEAVGTYTTTDKNADDLKASMIEKVRSLASSTLGHSDWYVIREIEGGTATPTEWTTYRAAVRQASNTKETEIAALTDMDAVKSYQNHPMIETRKVAVYDDDSNVSYGPDTEELNRDVDKTTFGWPTAPDAKEDPAFVSIEDKT